MQNIYKLGQDTQIYSVSQTSNLVLWYAILADTTGCGTPTGIN